MKKVGFLLLSFVITCSNILIGVKYEKDTLPETKKTELLQEYNALADEFLVPLNDKVEDLNNIMQNVPDLLPEAQERINYMGECFKNNLAVIQEANDHILDTIETLTLENYKRKKDTIIAQATRRIKDDFRHALELADEIETTFYKSLLDLARYIENNPN